VGVPTFEILGLPLGSFGTKWHLVAGPMARHKIYYKEVHYKGEGGESCEFVFARGSCEHQNCSNYALTNLSFRLCRSVWMIDCLSFFLVLFRSSSTPLYPQSAASQGTHPNSFSFHCFHIWTLSWVHKELGASQTCPLFVWVLLQHLNNMFNVQCWYNHWYDVKVTL
jgi:hypothetical protein